jgi:hypothetical protein
MRSATIDEARRYCNQEDGPRKVAADSYSVYYDLPQEHAFFIELPTDYRGLALLCHKVVGAIYGGHFPGALVWLHLWNVGADYLMPLGWRIVEDMRRAHGDTRPLDVAPAQIFREDEGLDLQVFLMTVFGNGWSGCLVPAMTDFAVEFRTSHRLFFYCASKDALSRVSSELAEFDPRHDG